MFVPKPSRRWCGTWAANPLLPSAHPDETCLAGNLLGIGRGDLFERLFVAARRHPTYVLMQTFEKPLLMFLLKHVTSGAAGGMVLGIGLLLLDIAGLRTLMGQSEDGVIAILLLFFGLMVTFGAIAMAVGIMTMNGLIERD